MSKDHITCAGPPPSWASSASLQPDAGPCWAPATETVILAQIHHHYLICPRIGVARSLGIIGENIMFGSCLLTAMCRRSIYSTAPTFCQYQHLILLPLVIFTTATVHDIQTSCKIHKVDICLVIASAYSKLCG